MFLEKREMNRGVLQQMVWNMNNMRPPSHHQQPSNFFIPSSNFFPQYYMPPATSSSSWHDSNQELPESWSQLLLGGLVGEEDKVGLVGHHDLVEPNKKLENWEEQQMLIHLQAAAPNEVVKQESLSSANNSYFYGQGNGVEEYQIPKPTWSAPILVPSASSPKSCITSLSTNNNNVLDFSNKKATNAKHPPPDFSSECNSSANGGALKKARTNPPSSTQPTFKVRKEKLGDRITALHQIVSPFGKTDTASVLLEAIGYIRFLHSQIEALSLPYWGSGSRNMRQQQQPAQGEKNCLFPEDPGQLLNDNSMKRKTASDQQGCDEEPKRNLRSKGLCLVPISCTIQVGSETSADYWAPTLNGGYR